MSNSFTFPKFTEIPDDVKVIKEYNGQYLLDGEIHTWDGKCTDIMSCICTTDDGAPKRVRLGSVAKLSFDEGKRAVEAARTAWGDGRGQWPTMRTGERIAAVLRFCEEMAKVREEVVRLLMWEIGKTRKDAETEFDRTLQYIRDTCAELKKLENEQSRFKVEEGFLAQIRRAPLGVVLCMGPFNYPLNETYTTLFPALIMGNTCVSKLPRHGALCHVPLFEPFRKCFPKGVCNIISAEGAAVISPLVETGHIDCIAFIGSSKAANALKVKHPKPNRLRCIAGMEAKNPAIVLPDADLDATVKEAVSGCLSFNGQRCTALKIIFVHETIHEKFLEKLVHAVDELKLGLPWEKGTQITPLPEDKKGERLKEYIDDAVSKGAKVLNNGGWFSETIFKPAVVFPVSHDARLYSEEQFGPIIPVMTYKSLSDIDHFIRESQYGQQISVFGKNPQEIGNLIDILANQVCRINLNSQCRRGPDTFPFTGRKDSAEGTLSVYDALRSFSIRTLVAAAVNDENKALVNNIVAGRHSTFLTMDYLF